MGQTPFLFSFLVIFFRGICCTFLAESEQEREKECSDRQTDNTQSSYIAGSVPSNGVPMNLSAWGVNKGGAAGGTQKKGRNGR